MKLRKIIILLLLVFVIARIRAASPDSTGIFIPDKKVMELAQDYDRVYFPLFLKSLEAIRSCDTSLIGQFFNSVSIDQDTSLNSISSVDDIRIGFHPIYVNPTDKSKYEVMFPVKWIDTAYTDPSWNLWFSSLDWLKKYILSDDIDSTFLAFQVINDYIISHTEYPDNTSRFTFGDHASALRLKIFTSAFNRYKQLNIQIKSFEIILLNAILSHLFYLVSLEHYYSWTNHAILVDNGLIKSLQGLPEFKLREQFLNLAFSRIFEQYRYSFTNEGIHKEHSPCYHYAFTNALNSTVEAAKDLNINIPEELKLLTKKANQYNNYLDNQLYSISVGDCYYSKGGQISKDPFKQGFKVFPESGWAYIKDTALDLSIVINSDFHSFSHYQKDETSFILGAGGHDLIIDPGLFSYDKESPFYYYMQSAFAHNVLIADEQDYKPDLKNTGLSGFTRYYLPDNNPNSGIIEMTHPHYHALGISTFRQFIYCSDRTLIIVDSMLSDTSHRWSQLFHLSPGAKLKIRKKNILISWDDHPYYLEFKSNQDDFSFIEGSTDPLQGWYFPAHNKAEKAPVLILTWNTHKDNITTLIELHCKQCNLKAPENEKPDYKELIKLLNNQTREKLVHVPFPRYWKPNRY